jgi:uncharacterized protein (DUF2141 family)
VKPSRIRTVDPWRNAIVRVISVAAWIVPTGPVAADDAVVEVIVTGLASQGATLNCALFSMPQGFPDPRTTIAKVTAAVSEGRAVCRFSGVRAGSCAVAAFEDRSGNGVPDTNVFGVPTEGVAFSRDARGRLGPPSFEVARFVHGTEATRLQLRAFY